MVGKRVVQSQGQLFFLRWIYGAILRCTPLFLGHVRLVRSLRKLLALLVLLVSTTRKQSYCVLRISCMEATYTIIIFPNFVRKSFLRARKRAYSVGARACVFNL